MVMYIDEYNDLINESNIINNKIQELDENIISSNNGIVLAKKNIKYALITAGGAAIACASTILLKSPSLVPLIFGGVTAVSLNWAITAGSYINVERSIINDFNKDKISFLDKKEELKKKIISIEKEHEKKEDIDLINNSSKTNINKNTKRKVKSI